MVFGDLHGWEADEIRRNLPTRISIRLRVKVANINAVEKLIALPTTIKRDKYESTEQYS